MMRVSPDTRYPNPETRPLLRRFRHAAGDAGADRIGNGPSRAARAEPAGDDPDLRARRGLGRHDDRKIRPAALALELVVLDRHRRLVPDEAEDFQALAAGWFPAARWRGFVRRAAADR